MVRIHLSNSRNEDQLFINLTVPRINYGFSGIWRSFPTILWRHLASWPTTKRYKPPYLTVIFLIYHVISPAPTKVVIYEISRTPIHRFTIKQTLCNEICSAVLDPIISRFSVNFDRFRKSYLKATTRYFICFNSYLLASNINISVREVRKR